MHVFPELLILRPTERPFLTPKAAGKAPFEFAPHALVRGPGPRRMAVLVADLGGRPGDLMT